jgi:threonine/homoserine/homoserine lactone efflux protein
MLTRVHKPSRQPSFAGCSLLCTLADYRIFDNGAGGFRIGSWRPILTLILAAAVVMGSPGPTTMSMTAVGAAFGLRRSLGYLCGIVLGTLAVLLVVAVGIVSMLVSLPWLAPVLATASAVYIIYLAFRIATAPPLSAQHRDASAPSFGGGFLLGVANPKAYVAIAAVFAGSAFPVESPVSETLIRTAILGFMIVVIHVCWLLAGISLSRFLRDPTNSRVANLFAAILVATTVIAMVH